MTYTIKERIGVWVKLQEKDIYGIPLYYHIYDRYTQQHLWTKDAWDARIRNHEDIWVHHSDFLMTQSKVGRLFICF